MKLYGASDDPEFDLSTVLPVSLEWLLLENVPTTGMDMIIAALPKLPRLKKLWVKWTPYNGHGQRVGDGLESVRCIKTIQTKVKELNMTWASPDDMSPFVPYLKGVIGI